MTGAYRGHPRTYTPHENASMMARLRDVQEKVGSQARLADLLGISQQNVSVLLRGGGFGRQTAKRLADIEREFEPAPVASPDALRFQDNLRSLLTERRIHQSELARRVGVPSATVSRWVSGERMPVAPLLLAMAKIFEVDPWTLLGSNAIEPVPAGPAAPTRGRPRRTEMAPVPVVATAQVPPGKWRLFSRRP